MTTPPYLQKGDRIGIVAPGRKVRTEEMAGVEEIIKRWGLVPQWAKNVFSEAHNYLAGTDDQRLSDLQPMLDDASVRAVICARGGYGTTRILDKINFDAFKKSPKWIIGFSDITSLHLQLYKEGFVSIHGTMPILFPKKESKESVEALRKILFGDSVSIDAPACLKNKTGKAVGRVIGGNFSLVVDSLATANEVDTGGKILVLEEIDEYRYKIDRMLVQLKRAGKLSQLAGLVIGHFTDIKDSTLAFGETVEEIILHHIQEYNFPVGFKFPIGHENPNLPFKHGSVMELHVEQNKSVLKPANV